MSTSLKEQLQSLGLSASTHQSRSSSSSVKKQNRPVVPQPFVKTQKPVWLEQAQYGVELLKAHFPACFKEVKEVCPLKVGIKQDLVKSLSTCESIVMADKACMVNSLAYYVNSPVYHKRVIEGAVRIDLQGQPAGIITAEEAKYSLECRKTRQQKKQNSFKNNASHPVTAEESK